MMGKSIEIGNQFHLLQNPSFRKGLCLKPGFRYGSLRPYCKDIIFATDGYKTNLQEIGKQLARAFQDFDPDEDCIVPTGTSTTNMLAGYLLHAKFPDSSIAVAFFQKETMSRDQVFIPEDYRFYRFYPQQLLGL